MKRLNNGNGSTNGISRFDTQRSGRIYFGSQKQFLELKPKLIEFLEELITYRKKYGKLKDLKTVKEVPDNIEVMEKTIKRLRL